MRCLDEISFCVGCRMFFLMVCVVRTVESWMLKDAGDGVYTMVHIDVAWFCVCASWAVQWRWWLVKVRVRWETEGFVWKVSDSCHQHA